MKCILCEAFMCMFLAVLVCVVSLLQRFSSTVLMGFYYRRAFCLHTDFITLKQKAFPQPHFDLQ